MDRNDFAAGKKVEEEAKPDARAKAKVTAAQAQVANGLKADGSKMIGEGHAAVGRTLIPNSFIEKMDAFIPDKKQE